MDESEENKETQVNFMRLAFEEVRMTSTIS